MTIQDLINVCDAENIAPENVRIVIGFVGGGTFNVDMVDGNEAGDNTTMFLTITEEVQR